MAQKRTYETCGKQFTTRKKADRYARNIANASGIRVPVYETTGAANAGPLESLKLKDHCEMCGAKKRLEPAFDPSGKPKTLCFDCRIGSAELLAARRKPYILITVDGGVADIAKNEGADVDILDWDNLKDGNPRVEFSQLTEREQAYVLEVDPDFQLRYEDAETGGDATRK